MKATYEGPYPRVSVPGFPKQYVARGDEVEVPDGITLPTTWRKVDDAVKKKPAPKVKE